MMTSAQVAVTQFELTKDSVIATVRCPTHQREAFRKALPIALWVEFPGVADFVRSETNCSCAVAYRPLRDRRNMRELKKLGQFQPRNFLESNVALCACYGRLIE